MWFHARVPMGRNPNDIHLYYRFGVTWPEVILVRKKNEAMMWWEGTFESNSFNARINRSSVSLQQQFFFSTSMSFFVFCFDFPVTSFFLQGSIRKEISSMSKKEGTKYRTSHFEGTQHIKAWQAEIFSPWSPHNSQVPSKSANDLTIPAGVTSFFYFNFSILPFPWTEYKKPYFHHKHTFSKMWIKIFLRTSGGSKSGKTIQKRDLRLKKRSLWRENTGVR